MTLTERQYKAVRKGKDMDILKYKLSKDGKGLLKYFKHNGKISFYHVHSKELSPLEKWIKMLLKKHERFI